MDFGRVRLATPNPPVPGVSIRPRITKADNLQIRDQRLWDESERSESIRACLSASDSQARLKSGVSPPLLKPVYANGRCLTWGTILPMTQTERWIHGQFTQGLGMDDDVTSLPTRPLYVISKASTSSGLVIRPTLVHPVISSATIPVGSMDADALLGKCREGINLIKGSTHSPRHRIKPSEGVDKLIGRFSVRAVDLESAEGNRKPTAPTSVNMSSSCIMFVVALGGKVWTCRPSMETLRLMSSKSVHKVSTRTHMGRLYIYLWSDVSGNDSHIKLSSNGAFTLVGSPSAVRGLAKSFKAVVEETLSGIGAHRDLVSTLMVSTVSDEP